MVFISFDVGSQWLRRKYSGARWADLYSMVDNPFFHYVLDFDGVWPVPLATVGERDHPCTSSWVEKPFVDIQM